MATKEVVLAFLLSIVFCVTLCFITVQMRGCESESRLYNASQAQINKKWYRENGYELVSKWHGSYWKKTSDSNE